MEKTSSAHCRDTHSPDGAGLDGLPLNLFVPFPAGMVDGTVNGLAQTIITTEPFLSLA